MNFSYLRDAFARRASLKKTVWCPNSASEVPEEENRDIDEKENTSVNKTLVRCHSQPDPSSKKSKTLSILTTIRQKLKWKKRNTLKNKLKSQSSHELAYSVSEESSTDSVLSAKSMGSLRCRMKKSNTRSIHPTSQPVAGDYVDATTIANEMAGASSTTAESLVKRSLTCQLLELPHCGWYWGPINREESEKKLDGQPDGSFLVRDSSSNHYLLSLSFRSYGRTLHTRIEHCNGLFSFYSNIEQEGFESVTELIEQSIANSKGGIFCYSKARTPGSFPFPVRLTKPVSRFTEVRSLQHLCRFVIRQYTRVDNIQKLPLPKRLKDYIEESHY